MQAAVQPGHGKHSRAREGNSWLRGGDGDANAVTQPLTAWHWRQLSLVADPPAVNRGVMIDDRNCVVRAEPDDQLPARTAQPGPEH
jgi:hypothetical protein